MLLTLFTEKDRPSNDLRRSLRLQGSGYYNADGTPVISYKETLYRVFKKRRFNRVQRLPDTNGTHEELKHASDDKTPTHRAPRSFKYTFMMVFFVFLAFCHNYYGNVIKLQQENEERNGYMRLLATEADRRPNFASSCAGATVIRSRSSDTFRQRGFAHMFLSWWFPKYLPALKHQSPLVPGQCWPFFGDRGHLHVQLTHSIQISHVTIGHIGKEQSLDGSISSAPREFSIYGMTTLNSEERFLGKFIYDQNGPSFQTFTLPDQDQNQDVYQHVRLQVESNWGNTEYTCLYNFRVHGKLPTRSDNIVL